MDFIVTHGDPSKQTTPCTVVGVFEGNKLSAAARKLDKASKGALSRVCESGDMDGKAGQAAVLRGVHGLACERVLLVGCGKESAFDAAAYRKAVDRAVKALKETGSTEAAVFLCELKVKGRDNAWCVRSAVETAEATLYRFDQLKKKNKDEDKTRLERLALHVSGRDDVPAGEAAAREGRAVAAGTALAMDLGNLPGNICTPSYLAKQAQELQQGHAIKTTVLEQADMEELGMGALLSVSRGSRQAPKLIVMEYSGGKKGDAPVVLVGKGLTFDAGGISLKPAANMDEMKYDMCGGASVIGVMKAVAELELPVNVVGVVPSSENLPDGDANKPGDIVTSMSGQTIEILNTDAEGRLILCDALTYSARFKPAVVIDIATLTGACVVALGAHASGLLGNSERLVKDLLAAGEQAGDRAWQLPLWEDYQKQLDSNFADLANIGGREAGAVTAACFLARFTKSYKWAHLDIAGTAWRSGKDKGATGRPVPLLMEYLIGRAGKNKRKVKRGK
jgi:leucyl aminopeptidase